jgi:beta-lactam-binding protein with PASTA domain
VVSQNPPAGTAVPEGMTIEVRVASKSDIPVGVFVPGLTGPIKELSYAAFEELAINDPTVKETRTTGTLDPAKEAAFVDAFNTKLAAQGATGRVSATEAQVVFGNFKNAGLFSLAR